MAASLMPNGKQQFFNSAGAPLAGGRIYTYAAGSTTTNKATYTTAAASVQNSNPVILDARGEATIFWSGAYNVVVKDASDNLIYSTDNYTTLADAIAAQSGASLMGFIQAGTGAVARTQQHKSRELFSVLDFGDFGDGGDYASAFAAAAAALDGPMFIPPGRAYKSGPATIFDKSFGLYQYEPSTDTSTNDTFSILRDVRGSHSGQYCGIKSTTSIASTCAHQEVGIFSILNVAGNAQHHVGMYSQVNLTGAGTTFGYGFCAEVGNTQLDGTGTSSDQALVGYESDVKSKYAYTGVDDATTRKTGYSAVAWGGGSCTEAFSVYSCSATNGNGTYNTGDWIFGLKMRAGSLNSTLGTGVMIDSDHSSGIVLNGKSAVYGINLAGSASVGNVGINIGSGYSIGIALPTNKAIKFDGAAGVNMIYHDTGLNAVNIQTAALSLSSFTTYGSASAGASGALPATAAGYLGVYVNGTLRKVPFYAN